MIVACLRKLSRPKKQGNRVIQMSHEHQRAEADNCSETSCKANGPINLTTTGKTVCTLPYKSGESETALV